ncbi:MAG TPA: DUF2306 domain-containing protein [Acidimicrobiia bacterium]|jgi:uncharacterized membrane protein YozB (DUF420 family)|nr:DUF2306 domain-containing protein [Acidimicrobiia bacterium]
MATARKRVPAAWVVVFFLIAVVLVFVVIRVTIDSENIATGVIPEESEFDRRYAQNPILAYAHIIPGIVYLVLAPFQISRRFRNRHLDLHRKLGRILVPTGILSGVFGVIFGFFFSFGGFAEASAAVVFGTWFVVALALAYSHIWAGDTVRHRRWMIRAFAIGLGVGTIRIWVGLFEATGMLDFDDAFGAAFWLSWSMHVLAAEIWLLRRPT